MDQVIEIVRHPSSKGVHHKVYSFLHHLHLGNYVRWNYIGDGWPTCVLSFWSAWGVASFQLFLVPPLSAGAFLILLLSIKVCILLVQLFF